MLLITQAFHLYYSSYITNTNTSSIGGSIRAVKEEANDKNAFSCDVVDFDIFSQVNAPWDFSQ